MLDMVRSMMSYAQLSSSFWGYAVETAVYILNNVLSMSVSKTPFKLLRGRKLSLSHFRIWGCPSSTRNSKKDLLPFRHRVHLSKEQCLKTPQEVEDIRRIPYASITGSLIYVMLCTRPDICHAVRIVSRKFTSGSVFTVNRGAVIWCSIKQGCIAYSIMEAEYVVACKAAKEVAWLRKFLHDLEVVPCYLIREETAPSTLLRRRKMKETTSLCTSHRN
ncbi:gag/pol protein [Cucumis melo var. makuwa]|uniref:Gag/pol protein n=1 Tax=Cucumis melo var. makuwa TaxID=1194695 RepID=A0A5A7UKM1_CUCMM|nr:gag/pol protein [Cucumis melo var. makuwa]TYK27772.1 gag/pol protein [Cucumis melo var. makuwa]